MIFKLVIKNLWLKPLNTVLSLVLLCISVAIISVLMFLQDRFESQYSNNIKDVDMVIGAKGSPLQLILSSVFHIDAPTGNIKYSAAGKWMRHPYVATAIPLAYGDSYQGYAVVGTTADFGKQFGATLERGRMNSADFEIVVGDNVARKLHLQLGSQFYSAHGRDEHAEKHTEHAYTVTGILNPSGTVVDNLLLSNLESVWEMHEHGDHEHLEPEDEHHHEEQGATPEPNDTGGREITAVLVKFRNPMGQMQLPRLINEQTDLMAAVPAIEVNRLFTLFGVGVDILSYVGWGIMALSGLSVFISMFNSLKERKYELALIRTMGGSRNTLLALLLLEGGILSVTGLLGGILLSRILIGGFSGQLESSYQLNISSWITLWPGQTELSIVTILLGLTAALIPAVSAWFINISKTLSHE